MSADHSEPAREAVALVRRIRETERYYEPGDKHRSERFALSDDDAARLLSASPAPAASGGLEALRDWPPLKKALWDVVTAAELNAPRYVNAYEFTDKLYAAALAAPAATGGEADMRRICEALGFDPTNHHNAAKCPYCNPDHIDAPKLTYRSTQATTCAGCGEHKHTPLRRDEMGGYVCLTCIDKRLNHPAPSETGASLGVKALEWVKDGSVWFAHGGFGQGYQIYTHGADGVHRVMFSWSTKLWDLQASTLDEAKAAAQSDFETRIRAALEGRADG